MTAYTTNPIPVFPTEGAHTGRTPMGKAIEWATHETTGDPAILATLSTLPPETTKELVDTRVAEYLDEYEARIQTVAMELAMRPGDEEPPAGIYVVWHGTAYTISSTPDVAPGYLVEYRCDCHQQAHKQARAAAARLN